MCIPQYARVCSPTFQADQLRDHGNKAMKEGNYKAALFLYNQAMELTPCDVRLYTNRSLAHLHLRRWRDAEVDATTVLHWDQDNLKALLRRSRARENRGDLPVQGVGEKCCCCCCCCCCRGRGEKGCGGRMCAIPNACITTIYACVLYMYCTLVYHVHSPYCSHTSLFTCLTFHIHMQGALDDMERARQLPRVFVCDTDLQEAQYVCGGGGDVCMGLYFGLVCCFTMWWV